MKVAAADLFRKNRQKWSAIFRTHWSIADRWPRWHFQQKTSLLSSLTWLLIVSSVLLWIDAIWLHLIRPSMLTWKSAIAYLVSDVFLAFSQTLYDFFCLEFSTNFSITWWENGIVIHASLFNNFDDNRFSNPLILLYPYWVTNGNFAIIGCLFNHFPVSTNPRKG